MDAIKKKMQAMKLEKDNAMDRADACEQQAKDANLRAERVSEFSFGGIIGTCVLQHTGWGQGDEPPLFLLNKLLAASRKGRGSAFKGKVLVIC